MGVPSTPTDNTTRATTARASLSLVMLSNQSPHRRGDAKGFCIVGPLPTPTTTEVSPMPTKTAFRCLMTVEFRVGNLDTS